ncbi:MAG: hypothetical protein ACPG3V_03690 [Porticoccaceae bacterium]
MKNCHLPSYNRVATLVLAAFITFVPSTGWAGIIEGNLTVEKNSSADPSDGNLTVEGTTTLKGNITLGDDASDTTIFKRKVAVDGNLTVEGNLKIQSVDSAGGGVVTTIPTNSDDDTIPTTEAVKKYVDSKLNTNIDIDVYYPANYKFKKAEDNKWNLNEFFILTTNDQSETPVSKELEAGGTILYVLYSDNVQYVGNSGFASLTEDCTTYLNPWDQAMTDVPGRLFRAWNHIDNTDTRKTLYFCLQAESGSPVPSLTFAQISTH